MNKNTSKQRDRWDKAQIIAQIISGVVLAGIAVVLSVGSSQISASIQKGQFLSGVIDDLTSIDNRGRRDIALIALDRFLGDSETELVIEVAQQVIRNSSFDSVESQIAFKILENRDSEQAQRILDEIAKTVRKTISAADDIAGPAEIPQSPAILKAQTRIAKVSERIGGNIIYIQFSGKENRGRVDKLAKELREQGFKVPGIEHRDFNFNDVRFFRPEDRVVAEEIAESVQKLLNIELKVKDLSQSRMNAPKGLIEVWLGSLEVMK